jgi:hypothetical protein
MMQRKGFRLQRKTSLSIIKKKLLTFQKHVIYLSQAASTDEMPMYIDMPSSHTIDDVVA